MENKERESKIEKESKSLDEYMQECEIQRSRHNPGRNRIELRKWLKKHGE